MAVFQVAPYMYVESANLFQRTNRWGASNILSFVMTSVTMRSYGTVCPNTNDQSDFSSKFERRFGFRRGFASRAHIFTSRDSDLPQRSQSVSHRLSRNMLSSFRTRHRTGGSRQATLRRFMRYPIPDPHGFDTILHTDATQLHTHTHKTQIAGHLHAAPSLTRSPPSNETPCTYTRTCTSPPPSATPCYHHSFLVSNLYIYYYVRGRCHPTTANLQASYTPRLVLDHQRDGASLRSLAERGSGRCSDQIVT